MEENPGLSDERETGDESRFTFSAWRDRIAERQHGFSLPPAITSEPIALILRRENSAFSLRMEVEGLKGRKIS